MINTYEKPTKAKALALFLVVGTACALRVPYDALRGVGSILMWVPIKTIENPRKMVESRRKAAQLVTTTRFFTWFDHASWYTPPRRCETCNFR